jgi:hypothetical protein
MHHIISLLQNNIYLWPECDEFPYLLYNIVYLWIYLPFSFIFLFGTPINIVNLALPTTHPYMDEVAFYIQNLARYIQILQIEPGAG